MERPTGVTVISVLQFCMAGAMVLLAVVLLLGAGIAGSMMRAGAGPAAMIAGMGAIGAAAVFIGALIPAMLGFGLWNLMNWARWITIIFAGLGILGALRGFGWGFHHYFFGFGLILIIRLAVQGAILWYLFQPNVRRAFGEAA